VPAYLSQAGQNQAEGQRRLEDFEAMQSKLMAGQNQLNIP